MGQEAAIAEIRRLGGSFVADESRPDKPLVVVNLNGTSATPADLRPLAGLTELRELHLADTHVGDDGLRRLHGLARLERLDLTCGGVTDCGLRRLQRLSRLERLDLEANCNRGEGLAYLTGLGRLTHLSLYGNNVGDGGLRRLGRLARLEVLPLGGPTEQSGETDITNAGLFHLRGLVGLRTLSLPGSSVGDLGLASQEGLRQLTFLNLRRTFVTDAGVRRLQRVLPGIEVWHGW